MNIRRNIAFGLAGFYLLSVIGIASNLHFCERQSAALVFSTTSKCTSCTPAVSAGQPAQTAACKTGQIAPPSASDSSANQEAVSKDYNIAMFIAPIIANFMQALLPNLFNKV